MALVQIRIKFSSFYSAFRPADIGYFTPIAAQALVDIGVGTALDTIPTGTVHAATPLIGKFPNNHITRLARDLEPIASEADRQLVAAEAGVLQS